MPVKVPKAIKGKSKIFGIEASASNFGRPLSAPAQPLVRAPPRATPAPKAAPVEDAPPAWTKRADLPDGKLARGWSSLLALDHDLVVTIAIH